MDNLHGLSEAKWSHTNRSLPGSLYLLDTWPTTKARVLLFIRWYSWCNQIFTAPKDQEKTKFTCPYGKLVDSQ